MRSPSVAIDRMRRLAALATASGAVSPEEKEAEEPVRRDGGGVHLTDERAHASLSSLIRLRASEFSDRNHRNA
jgi:hypothetical protein